MDTHAAGSSSGGSEDGGAAPRRNSRKPKCEISFHNTILLIYIISSFRIQTRISSLFSFSFSLGLEPFLLSIFGLVIMYKLVVIKINFVRFNFSRILKSDVQFILYFLSLR